MVSLVSDDTDEATVPASVTIPADAASTTFTVTAVDDGVLDAPATVNITASASGLTDGTAQVVVEDMLNHRMSQLTVVVQDQNGNPLPDATLDVSMTQHGFTFGTQVHDRFLTITETEFNGLTTGQKHGLIGDWNQTQATPVWQDALNYRAAVWSDFNHVIPTNGMQWIQYRSTGPVHLDRAISEAHSRGVTVTGHAVVWHDTLIGGSGPDVLSGDGGLDHVLGGPGSDQLFGGDDNDLLDGENGNDRIEGDGGRDVLLGAKDKDTLVGLDGEDLLIAGTTTLNHAERLSIRDEWGSNRSQSQRLSNVRGDSGRSADRLNTAFLVGRDRTDQTQTVFDDGKKDVLTGSGAEDAFFASLVDQLTDKLEIEWLELL